MASDTSQKSRLILASASTGRRHLLESIQLSPDLIVPADIDETPLPKEPPGTYVVRLAQEKAQVVRKSHPNDFIIAGDTIACCGRTIIGKANDEKEAYRTLTLLSGRRHRVYSGVCVINPQGVERVRKVLTTVQFKRLDEKELRDYIASGQWQGKSGCYGIQSLAGAFIKSINGSVSNVIGLPLYETRSMLLGLGFHL